MHTKLLFHQNCREYFQIISDEHYIATVLAANGMGNETDCEGAAMHVDWSRVHYNCSSVWCNCAKQMNSCNFLCDGLAYSFALPIDSRGEALLCTAGAWLGVPIPVSGAYVRNRIRIQRFRLP